MPYTRIKRFLIGEPLTSEAVEYEKIPKWKALSVLSSDALSSVAYATEEMLIPLAAFSVAAMAWSMPVAVAIGVLLLILTLSYRQTIEAYPTGGGAYIVAKENLGTFAGLTAGASLLIGYILTVAVSVAAGVAAITSAFPRLLPYDVGIAMLAITVLTILNLRGLRESATFFAFPTYFFILSIYALIAVGAWKLFTGQAELAHPIINETYPDVALFLVLRAFASGCAALTGIEAISNGVTAFQQPMQRNAKITLSWMAFLLGSLFLGVTLLAHGYGIQPKAGETAVSILGRSVFGESLFYYFIQAATAMILLLGANTCYAGFPILASVMARDRYLPRQLGSLGDKLVFSNGIIGLSVVAAFLVIIFHADTHSLVPLYALGVFLSFTLSQAGMVVHHLRHRKPGWVSSMLLNGTGAVTTLLVMLIIGTTKFTAGAWMVILVIPAMIALFNHIHRHYLAVGRELSLAGLKAPPRLEKMKHTVIVPISGIHRGVLEALRYAVAISDDVRACYVELDPDASARVQEEWNKWAREIPFVVLKSPYRSVIRPLLEYIDDVERITHNELVTIIIPEFVTAKWTHRLLHNQTALLIRTALMFKRNKVVTSVRYHLRET